MSSNVFFNDLLRKAQGAISNFRAGGSGFFLGRNGEVIFSKNNVCVHVVPSTTDVDSNMSEEEPLHTPGYLSIHCLNDEQLGFTLVLQWLPNTLLEKNPTSIRCVSPRHENAPESAHQNRNACSNHARGESEEEGTATSESMSQILELTDSQASTAICVESNEETEMVELWGQGQRPQTLLGADQGLSVPSINLIPNTPIEQENVEENIRERSESSGATSGEDDPEEDEEEEKPLSSCDDNSDVDRDKANSLDTVRKSCVASLLLGSIPEHFARELKGEEGPGEGEGEEEKSGQPQLAMAKERVHFQQQPRKGGGGVGSSLFSVNLGKMRSLRVFYSDPERTSGQLVIASPDSQYKIFHFHHAGLDKLAAIFERWNAVKARTAGNDSPSVLAPDRHFCPAGTELSRAEMDPEDGLYERLSWDLWRSYVSQDGSVEDSVTIRKTIFFASMEPDLRRELWPFLLRIFPWSSSLEHREQIRNDLFLRYQRLKRNRIRKMAKATAAGDTFYTNVESSILKDVVRTDRRNSFFAGEENANLELMKSILLTYAVRFPEINYIQGMSDLLAPLLYTLRDEPLAYWCFCELMKQTLFCQSNEQRSVMEIQLDYLRELFRMFAPEFFAHLEQLGGDSPNLMFVHRWILLFFKREFPPREALHIWEACWVRFRTAHFHLFIACAIVSIYGPDVVAQKLPHDEILLYFSSLAMHMDAGLILRKARGLLYQFHREAKIPCTLAALFETETDSDQWNSHVFREFECTKKHVQPGEDGKCPYAS